ncbi:MAG: outer membrane beta-barrel protein [Sandaracinaceae bacterium]|nr:outer membrane beta-barrel protein [Sandaracinaceae bacterium]
MAGNRVSIGGADIALRLRPSPWVAVDLGIGAYGGTDYDGNDRVEVPFTVNGLFFFNPQNALQLYGVLGLGVSYAHVEPSFLGSGFDPFSSEFRDFTYFGGQAGLGLEWRMSPHFALNVDVRGFIRSRVDSTTDVPEFVETNAAGSPTGRTSNTSSGVYSTLGATLYF